MEEISRITGGRILSSDPNQANLYDYTGLSFPETNLPLLRPLMLIWLGLFLLDVAVRRVIVDVKAPLRRIKAWVLSATRRAERDETISRLQARREKLRQQWCYVGRSRPADEDHEAEQKRRQGRISASRSRQSRADAPIIEQSLPFHAGMGLRREGRCGLGRTRVEAGAKNPPRRIRRRAVPPVVITSSKDSTQDVRGRSPDLRVVLGSPLPGDLSSGCPIRLADWPCARPRRGAL